jgi:L-alanine-DL-glutamate epimerase-like enolase superfamily enzyme
MTTYTLPALPVSDALAARLAALLEAAPAEHLEAAAEAFADTLEAAADAWIDEPLDTATLDLLKERAEEVKAGARLYTLDDLKAATDVAILRGMEKRQQQGQTA